MRKQRTAASLLAIIIAALCVPSQTDAAPITVWNYNSSTTNPTTGTGTMTSDFAAANIMYFSGTTINAQGGDVAGQALALQGGTANINNGKNLTFSASTAGFDTIRVSFAIQRTGTGFNNNQFQYSLDGVSYTDFGSPFDPPVSFGVQSFDLSSIAGLNNNPNASFRIVFNGVTSASGNNRIDNLVISGDALPAAPPPAGPAAVPEPLSITVFAFSLLSLGAASAWRRRHARQ